MIVEEKHTGLPAGEQPAENSEMEGRKLSIEKIIAKILAVTRRKYGLE